MRGRWWVHALMGAAIVFALLVLSSFAAARTGEGGLLGAYRPAQGKALSEQELVELDSRLGIGFIGTEFIMWIKESILGGFGWKPPTLMALTLVHGIGWLVARRSGRAQATTDAAPDSQCEGADG